MSASVFRFVYDKRNGEMFSSLQYNGKEYLNRPMEVTIWRAPTDNDRTIQHRWKAAHYHETYTRAYETRVEQQEHLICLKSHGTGSDRTADLGHADRGQIDEAEALRYILLPKKIRIF